MMICPNCKKTLPPNSSICGFCGCSIKDNSVNQNYVTNAETEKASKAAKNSESENRNVTEDKDEAKIEDKPVGKIVKTEKLSADKDISPESKPVGKVVKSAKSSSAQAISKVIDKSKKIINKNQNTEDTKQSEQSHAQKPVPQLPQNKVQPVPVIAQKINQQNESSKPADDIQRTPENKEDIEKRQVLQTTMIMNEQEKKKLYASPEKFFKRYKPVSTAGFFFTELLLVIPVLNIILLFVWAFRGNSNSNRKAFARSILIWIAIAFIILFIAAVLCLTLLAQNEYINSVYYNIVDYISNYPAA